MDNKNDNDIKKNEKSFLGWWSRLTEYSIYLFKYNLMYLIFILPSFVCVFIFIIFNAYLFLIAGLMLFIFAGPAILVLHETADKIAEGKAYSALPRFFNSYRKNWRTGIIFAIILDTILFITLYPLYFVLVINSIMKIPIMICAMMTLIIVSILTPHIIRCILSDGYKNIIKRSVISAVNNIKASFFAGILQLVWIFLCVLFPYISIVAALIGVPAVIRMSVMYILPQSDAISRELNET